MRKISEGRGVSVFGQDVDSKTGPELTWQGFEETVREALDAAGYSTEFRKIFNSGKRRYEVDVIARKFDTCILIDAKYYGRGRYRPATLKTEAKKHSFRCHEFERVFQRPVVPVIVSWIDDSLIFEGGCFIVPFEKLQDFVTNVEFYLETFDESDIMDLADD